MLCFRLLALFWATILPVANFTLAQGLVVQGGQLIGGLVKSAQANNPPSGLTSDQIIEKASPSVALVLVGKSPSELSGLGSAIVIRENGVLLTAFHVIKDAKAVQIRFKNGETFDDVQLLGVDRRRDVAALRIAAGTLPALKVASAAAAKPGDSVWTVSHAANLPWTASTGIVSAYRLADEVPGAGSGYRLLQFTASASPGSSGGVLVDSQAQALGLIVGTMESGQNLNFAVPIENVLGLADVATTQTYPSGATLRLPETKDVTKAKVPSAAPQPPQAIAAPEPESEEVSRSEILKSKDPDFILRHFRTLYVDTRKATWFGDTQMKAALGREKGLVGMKISVVDDPSLADVVLEVAYTFMWDYPFSLRHQNTTIVLLSGKGSGVGGPAASASVAKELAKLLKPYRSPAPPAK